MRAFLLLMIRIQRYWLAEFIDQEYLLRTPQAL
jgi:hypothetical protein